MGCLDELVRLGNAGDVTKVDRFAYDVKEPEPSLNDRLCAHFADDRVNVAGHVGVVCLRQGEMLRLLAGLGPPYELEQAIGQSVAHSVPFDDERNVVTPVGAEFLEGLPQRWRRETLAASDEPNLE